MTMRHLTALALATLLAGCGPSQADVDAAVAQQRQDQAQTDSLERAVAEAPTATGPAPTALDSIGIRELERNAHLERMIDSTQSSLGL